MYVKFEPFGKEVIVSANETILEAATSAGIRIESVCGGYGTCGKCRVQRLEGKLSEPTSSERATLSEEELEAGYRLACQARILSDARMMIPKESIVSEVSILSEGIDRSLAVDPWVKRHHICVPETDLREQLSDLENLTRAWPMLGQNGLTPTIGALRQLPKALRAGEGQISLVEADGRIIEVEANHRGGPLLGIAFDIGTTTIVGYLLDLETGEQIAVSSCLNPQTRYGDDVVSRIAYADQGEDALAILQTVVIEALNEIINDTLSAVGARESDLLAVTAVGNTTMHHLFLRITPSALAQSPYVPVAMQALCLTATELGLLAHPDAAVWVLPNIAGWVGADTVGVLLATDLWQADEIALAIDIGTNGEMALGSKERLLTCSTAAGPAFEGAHLSCGMRAAAGAIDWIRIRDDRVEWHVIGDSLPRGICGSGLVDALAEMLMAGVVDDMGRIVDGDTLRKAGTPNLAERVVGKGRHKAFILVTASESNNGNAIRLTQRDVRELQLAKGAIRSGIEILIKELAIAHDDVEVVYLAGAFGNYIRPESALTIGLIPHLPQARIVPVGNAAGSGAKMALLSDAARRAASELVRDTEYLELSGRPDFQDTFAKAMLFNV